MKRNKKKGLNQPKMAMGSEWVTKNSGAGYHTLKQDKRKADKLRRELDERLYEDGD